MKYKSLLVATNNQGKLKEYQEMLSPIGIEVKSLKDLNINIEVEENGDSYRANSYLKAKAIRELVDMPVISDDSGIEIASLGEHFPGIYSARYAKANGGYPAVFDVINEKIGGKDRSAEFHCCICYLEEKGQEPLYFEGVCKGHLLLKPVGVGGFGYDPLFHCDENGLNFGTATSEEKDHCSHRYHALTKFVEYLIKES